MYKSQIHRKGEKHRKCEAQIWQLSWGHRKCGNSAKQRVQSVEIQKSQKDFSGKWKAWKIKICILNNAIASNFVLVNSRDKTLTKDSAVYWSSLLPGKNLSFRLKAASGGLKTLD